MYKTKKVEAEESMRLLTKEESEQIIEKVKSFASKDGFLNIRVNSYWFGGVNWARNEPFVTRNSRNITVEIQRAIGNQWGWIVCNQIDDKSIESATKYAEYKAQLSARRTPLEMQLPPSEFVESSGPVWSDETFNRDIDREKKIFVSLLNDASQKELFSAGYLESFAARAINYSRDTWNKEVSKDRQLTQAQFSMTVRDGTGSASGWAGLSSYDYGRMSLETLGCRAIDKAVSSRDPVRIEPGRYTVILEPQASFAIFSSLINVLNRVPPEGSSQHSMSLGFDESLSLFRTKLGLKIIDNRITVSHDPEDPNTSTLGAEGVSSTTLIKNGVLVNMYNSIPHEVSRIVGLTPRVSRTSFSVEGTSATFDDMIASTERGLIVTRFDKIVLLDATTLLSTGLTRDGLWLVEKGKITRAVRNFRFTESSLFALNNVDQIGQAERVYNPVWERNTIVNSPQNAIASSVVPAIKIKDFSFTSTIDAI